MGRKAGRRERVSLSAKDRQTERQGHETFEKKLNRMAWVKVIWPVFDRKGCASLSICSWLGSEQVTSLAGVNELCPIYIRGQCLKPADDMA